jgi:hypothetical protein
VLIPGSGGIGASVAAIVGYTLGGVVTAFIFGRELGSRPSDLVPRGGDVRWLWRKATRRGT